MKFVKFSGIELADKEWHHGGEGRAGHILLDVMQKTGHTPIIVGGGTDRKRDYFGITCYPWDNTQEWDFQADYLVLEHVDPYGYSPPLPEELMERCSNNILLFFWGLAHDWSKVDPRVKGVILYTEEENKALVDSCPVPVYRWHPYSPYQNFPYKGYIGNVLAWLGGNLMDYRLEYIDQFFSLWEEFVLTTNSTWYMDICRMDWLIKQGLLHELNEKIDQRILRTPRTRYLPAYRYNDWLRYVSESSVFFAPNYTRTSQGIVEPALIGVPSILSPHWAVPDDYVWTCHSLEEGFSHLRDIYRLSREHWGSDVYRVRDKLRDQLRPWYSLERSTTEWQEICELLH